MKIKKGSKIREYGYGTFIDSTVITEPKLVNGKLEFKSETAGGVIIDYLKSESSLELLS